MTDPDYAAVSKSKFDNLKDDFKGDDKAELVNEIRRLFDDAEGELVYLKKGDTLTLADRLEASSFALQDRSDWVEMLESLKESSKL